ncbi:MAG TPA: hypothetical protein VGE61_05335, partial [Glycomyces sp.]
MQHASKRKVERPAAAGRSIGLLRQAGAAQRFSHRALRGRLLSAALARLLAAVPLAALASAALALP